MVNGIDPAEMKKIEEMKKTLLRSILTKDARERLNRIKLVKPDLALQLELYLVQLYQKNKIQGMINDEQLKAILEMMSSGKKFKIIKK
jgi:programmed cell death protein 5